jgi:DNA-binding XRE family transcriptional regulator
MIKVSINTKAIRVKRAELDMTQAQFALLVGANQGYICEIENGKIPSLKMLATMAHVLGCTIDELLIKEADNENNG